MATLPYNISNNEVSLYGTNLPTTLANLQSHFATSGTKSLFVVTDPLIDQTVIQPYLAYSRN